MSSARPLWVTKIAGHVVAVERLDDHLHAGFGQPIGGVAQVLDQRAVRIRYLRVRRGNAGETIDGRTAERAGVFDRLRHAVAELLDAVGRQARPRSPLVQSPIGRLNSAWVRPMSRRRAAISAGRKSVGADIFDAAEARPRRRGEAIEKRALGEQHRQVGGKLRHDRFPPRSRTPPPRPSRRAAADKLGELRAPCPACVAAVGARRRGLPIWPLRRGTMPLRLPRPHGMRRRCTTETRLSPAPPRRPPLAARRRRSDRRAGGAVRGRSCRPSEAVRLQHGHTLTWIETAPPDAVVFAETRAGRDRRGADRAAHDAPIVPFGAGTSLEGHVNALLRRRVDRLLAHEPGARRPRRGPRLRRRARRDAQGAQRAICATPACSSRSIPAPTPRSAAWRRRAPPAPTRCATAR